MEWQYGWNECATLLSCHGLQWWKRLCNWRRNDRDGPTSGFFWALSSPLAFKARVFSKQECLKTLPVVFEFEDCDFVHGGTIFWIFLSVHMIHIP